MSAIVDMTVLQDRLYACMLNTRTVRRMIYDPESATDRNIMNQIYDRSLEPDNEPLYCEDDGKDEEWWRDV